jgi:hypothetical protein
MLSTSLTRAGRILHVVLALLAFDVYGGQPSKGELTEVVCSYAPSQSEIVKSLATATGGAAAASVGLAKALGLSAVKHSSGALILSGSGGYLAGTLGTASVGPAIVTVAAVVGGTAVSIELLCTRANHKEGYEAVVSAANQFKKKASIFVSDALEDLGRIPSGAVQVSKDSITFLNSTAKDLYQRYWQ